MDGRWVFEDEDGNEDDDGNPHVVLSDGRKSIDYEGCDWKENPADCVLKLTQHEQYNPETHEIVEFEDGSDSYWYVLVEKQNG